MEHDAMMDSGNAPTQRSAWRVFKWAALGVLCLYIVIVIARAGYLINQKEEQERVAEIHHIRLTLADVDGTRLPPEPDAAINNQTIAGVDTNHNYVRDDVERWIFAAYPNPRERAAWMQWARADEMVMTMATSKETLRAVMEEGARATRCESALYDTYNNPAAILKTDQDEKQLESLIVNNQQRIAALDRGNSYMTSSGDMSGQQCDVYPEQVI